MRKEKDGAGKNQTTFGHGPMGTTSTRVSKIENESERFKQNFISLPVSKRIQQARIAAELTQKQLAQKINMKTSIVQSYENQKAVPVGRIIQLIESACGCPYGYISGKKRRKKKKILLEKICAIYVVESYSSLLLFLALLFFLAIS